VKDGARKSSADDDDLHSKFRLPLPIFGFLFLFFFSFLEIVYNNTVRVFSLTKKN
jgi:hypothetical protein